MKELNQFELKQVAGGADIIEDMGYAVGRGARWLGSQEWLQRIVIPWAV